MSRPATSRLKVNPTLGQRPSLEFRRIAELRIDPAYQRTIAAAASQTLIRRIAMFWDWALCQPLAVAKRDDGGLYVVDGQHRLEAARLRGDIDDLPCVVTPYRSAGDEAAAFVALNQQRRPLGAIDLFKAALAAEDESATAVMRLIRAAGLDLAPHTNFTAWKPGMVSNIAGIEKCFRIHGARTTEIALRTLARAFPGVVLRYAGSLFPGLSGFVAAELKTEGRVDEGRLVATVAQFTQPQWRATIAHEQAASGNDRKLAAKSVVTRLYRATLRPESRPAPPQPVREDIPPAAMIWCEQCDQRVSGAQANRCASPFCKARAEAA